MDSFRGSIRSHDDGGLLIEAGDAGGNFVDVAAFMLDNVTFNKPFNLAGTSIINSQPPMGLPIALSVGAWITPVVY